MTLIIPLSKIKQQDMARVGGKAVALAMMAQHSLNVPEALCVTTDAYNSYVTTTGLRERILLELNRKQFEDMRWEELWDTSLRIRNMFLTTPLPATLALELEQSIAPVFARKAAVVRSSALGEDSARTSFAGLHESYVNINGTASIIEHVRLVWASLWSDAALLYRQELGLNIEKSMMSVVIQEIINGEESGVAFGKNPLNESETVIEAIYGLNQGLVDGSVEPDRWIVDRATGEILSHTPAQRTRALVAFPAGVRFEPLSAAKAETPPLSDDKISAVFELVMEAEKLFDAPQDVEWTFRGNRIHALQSRPITARKTEKAEDQRSWYLSLRRSFDNLKALRSKIENELIPAMILESSRLAETDLSQLADHDLAREISKRSEIHKKWVDSYWSDFIPFAHGMRLFGQVYNDVIRPADPYEFMDLLGSDTMVSIERNRMLQEMALIIQRDTSLAAALRSGSEIEHAAFKRMLDEFVEKYAEVATGTAQTEKQKHALIRILLEMASRPEAEKQKNPSGRAERMDAFIKRFPDEQQARAQELLDLVRASYRMRDDDNLYLGKIEHQLNRALDEARKRLIAGKLPDIELLTVEELCAVLENPAYVPAGKSAHQKRAKKYIIKPRQLVGQPAGPGIGMGTARVIARSSELFDFKAGEILVCDAIDPAMTFVVPLTAGIVERRGGMLIHGAIIAREYGIACVTGVPDATELLHTGDQLTVDGYLGIVTIGKHSL
jgi:pyruvate,water dikinase